MNGEFDPATAPLAAQEGMLAEAAEAPVRPRGRLGLVLLAGSLLLMALNLRASVTSIGPVLPDVMRGTGLSAAGASVLTTLPSLCFGLFGAAAPFLARRVGIERALLLMLAVLVAGTALRGIPAAALLFAGQIIACGGIAVVNVLLPSLVKRDFPRHMARMTGLYTMVMATGAAGAAAATVPLKLAFGGSWSAALAFWAIPAALAGVIWAVLMPRRTGHAMAARYVVRGLWRDPLAWQVTLFMGLQSSQAYIVFGWLAPMLRDRGLSPVHAGLVLSVSVLSQAPASLLAPMLATRGRSQSVWAVGAMVLAAVGLVGCLYAPLGSVWGWAFVLGVGQGSVFSIALMLIVLRAPDSHVAAYLSGMAQGVGYVLASGGPLAAGLLHGWTGSWTAVAAFFVGISVVAGFIGTAAGRDRLVRAVSVRVAG